MKRHIGRPSPAFAISVVALFVAIGGTAVAVNKVTSKDIKRNAVRAKHIKSNAVRKAEIKAQAVGTSEVANDSLRDRDLSDYELIGNSYQLVQATDGANAAAARAAAPERTLFAKGQLEIYAKCFRDTGTNTTFARMYARTSQNGAVMEGEDDLPGGNAATDFLNTGTLEEDRELDVEEATGNDAEFNETEWALASPDGTGLTGQGVVGAKNGNLAGGNGLYGTGNVCLFQGSVLG
jgi:hypothetical protein